MLKTKIVIFLDSGTKLVDSFPIGRLCIDDFATLYRRDRYGKGWGIILYVSENTQMKSLTVINRAELKVCLLKLI